MSFATHPNIVVQYHDVTVMQFSGGERQVRVLPNHTFNQTRVREILPTINISAKIKDSNTLMDLLLVKDALDRRFPGYEFRLGLNYLPYARQDRVCADGEALSLAVFCRLINNMNFSEVIVWDCHSDVGLALLDRVKHVTIPDLIRQFPIDWSNTILVSPDAGALKKVLKLGQIVGSHVVRANKLRDPITGNITETVVYSDHVGDKNFLVVDDICDGGRTFIELAKVLKPKTDGKLGLYVTHGIFSQGRDIIYDYYDELYVANSMENLKS